MPGSERGVDEQQSGSPDPVLLSVALRELQARAFRLAQNAANRSVPPPIDWSSGDGQAKLWQELRWCGVPDKYARADWENCRAAKPGQQYAAKLDDYVKRGRGLIIMGSVGTGKSSLAGLICAEAVKIGLKPHWSYMPDLVAALSDRTGISDAVKKSKSADIEVWDDFGVGGLQAWQIGLLDRIVEARYQWNRPMVVTTNLTRKTLLEQASVDLSRLTDRWRERGVAITISGESMRSSWKDRDDEETT